jgi:tetratricopeptide (TPR) repeat protein
MGSNEMNNARRLDEILPRKDRTALITQSVKYLQMCGDNTDDSDLEFYDGYTSSSSDSVSGDSSCDESDLAFEKLAETCWRIRPTTQLLLVTKDTGACANSASRDSRDPAWGTEPKFNFKDAEMGLLSRLAQVCYKARLRKCNQHCCELDAIAPKCDSWKAFRDWALSAMACQYAMETDCADWKNLRPLCLSPAYAHVSNAVNALCTVFKVCKRLPDNLGLFKNYLDGYETHKIDVNSVMDLVFWMAKIQGYKRIGPRNFGHWTASTLPPDITIPSIAESLSSIEKLQICQFRLWGLIDTSDRKQTDLPSLVWAISQQGDTLRQTGHQNCVADKCHFTHIDTDQIYQMHKCELLQCREQKQKQKQVHRACKPDHCFKAKAPCQPKRFPVEQLLAALEQDTSTAWDIGSCSDHPKLSTPGAKHLAISHVWADGTGAHNGRIGYVNPCLLGCFIKIARSLDCKAIWWDVLSIPEERDARSKALNKMHYNYASAAATVVHDSYLISIPWKDDGSPCLALVLSSWFTRGWTALELSMSNRVKILFGDTERPGQFVIKDLDDEVLAKSPTNVSRMHWLASEKIKELRKPIESIGIILEILSPRSTSFARDRTKIAALLAGVPNCDFTQTDENITKDIMKYVGKVPQTCLMHGNPTIAASGPFSWCTSTLDGMPVDTSQDIGDALETHDVEIDEQGCAVGLWGCQLITPNLKIKPYGNNLATTTMIQVALSNTSHLLLLQPLNITENRRLLVEAKRPVNTPPTGPVLNCRYIGTVLIEGGEKQICGLGNSWICSARIGKCGESMLAKQVMEVLESKARIPVDGLSDEENKELPKLKSSSPWFHDAKEPSPSGAIPIITRSTNVGHDKSMDLCRAVRRRKKDAARWLVRDRVLLQGGQLQKASNFTINGFLDLAGMTMLGCIFLEQKKYGEAINVLSRAWERYTETDDAQIFSLLDKYRAVYSLGLAYNAHAKPVEAIKCFNIVFEIFGSDENAKNIYSHEASRTTPARKEKVKPTIGKGAQAAKVAKVIKTATSHDLEWTRLLLNTVAELTMLYVSQGHIKDAQETFKRGLKAINQEPSSEWKAFETDWLDRQIDVLSDRNRKQAEMVTKYERALKDFNVRFHTRHILVILTSLHLAVFYHHGNDEHRDSSAKPQNNLLRAEELLKQAESGLPNYFKKKPHPVLAMIQYHLGKVYAKRYNHAAAAQKLSEARITIDAIRKDGPGSWERLYITIQIALGHAQLELNKLGSLHAEREHFNNILEELIKYREQVIDREEMDGREKMDDADACLFAQIVIGAAHTALASRLDHLEAKTEGYCAAAISLLEKKFAKKILPIQWCEAQDMLARLRLHQEKFDEARQAAKASYEGFVRLSGKTTLAACNAARLVGDTYVKRMETPNVKPLTAEYEDAKDWLKRAVEGYDLVLGRHHPQTLRAYCDLGYVYGHQKRHEEAIEHYRHAHKGYNELLGPKDEVTINLATTIREKEMAIRTRR